MPIGGIMKMLSFTDAAALTYLLRRTDLTRRERAQLRAGLSPGAQEIAKNLERKKSASANASPGRKAARQGASS